MAGAVGLSVAAIDTLSSNMENSIAIIKAEIQKIEDASDAAKAGWKGDANAAFVKAANAWHDEAETLKSDLDALNTAVVSGKQKLLSMDQTNA